jgi:hypothetical protein
LAIAAAKLNDQPPSTGNFSAHHFGFGAEGACHRPDYTADGEHVPERDEIALDHRCLLSIGQSPVFFGQLLQAVG